MFAVTRDTSYMYLHVPADNIGMEMDIHWRYASEFGTHSVHS